MARTKRERVYDEQIAPLMRRVIATCKAHDIPMVFSAQLNDDRAGDTDVDDNGEPIPEFYCTTILVNGGDEGDFANTGAKMMRASGHMRPDSPLSFAAYAIPEGGAPVRVTGSDDGYDPLGGGGET